MAYVEIRRFAGCGRRGLAEVGCFAVGEACSAEGKMIARQRASSGSIDG